MGKYGRVAGWQEFELGQQKEMKNGRLKMADGRWQMADGRWFWVNEED
jgi:hypothetical protein